MLGLSIEVPIDKKILYGWIICTFCIIATSTVLTWYIFTDYIPKGGMFCMFYISSYVNSEY